MNSYLLVPSLDGKESDMLETYVLRGGLQARPPLKERIRDDELRDGLTKTKPPTPDRVYYTTQR